ncbi:MAG: hypothetical protein WCH58_03145 [Candidatus Saccharibacteria bacterium]
MENARNRKFSVSTPAIEEAKKIISKKINQPSIVDMIADVVGEMLDSKKFSGYDVKSCSVVAMREYQHC